MSEPMTTVEIEDVLSSIRRLVSEDLRPTHKLVSAALQKGASKLILTPALRIVSDVRTALPERGDAQDEPRDLAEVLHDIEVEESAAPAEIIPVFGSVRQIDPSDWPGQDLQGGATTFDANFLATAMSRINGLTQNAGDAARPSQSDTIEAVVAAVGAAVGPEEWEPDGGEPAPQAEAWGDTVWHSADAAEDPAPQAQADAVILAALPIADVAHPVAHDMRADTVLMLVASDKPTVVENASDLIGQDRIIFHDAASAADENQESPAAEAAESADELDDSVDFLSEDVLREIVRDMIREELQGNLGERITRNVRKLVRAEINRALASRDFDDVASQR